MSVPEGFLFGQPTTPVQKRSITVSIDENGAVTYEASAGMSMFEAQCLLYWVARRMDVKLQFEMEHKLQHLLEEHLGCSGEHGDDE